MNNALDRTLMSSTQTYITNLGSALTSLSAVQKANDIDMQIELHPANSFHGGGHINHSLF